MMLTTKHGSRRASSETPSRFAEHLDQWIKSHAVEIRPCTLADYRTMNRLYIKPLIGGLRLCGVRRAESPCSTGNLLANGSEGGKALGISTVQRMQPSPARCSVTPS
jgi:hypothetical protein